MKHSPQRLFHQKLLTHIASYSALQFIGPVMTLLLTPLYLRYLTITEFASLSLLWLLGLLVANCGNLKLDQALRAFYFDFTAQQSRQKERYFSQLFSVSLAISLLLIMGFGWIGETLFRLMFSDNYAFAAPLAPMVISIALLNQFANTAFVWQQNQEQLTRYSLFKLLPLTLNFSLQLLALLVWDMGLTGVVFAHLLSASLLGVAVLTHYRHYITTKINWPEILPSVRFALPLLLFGLLYYLDRNLDRAIVEKLMDTNHVAALGLWASLVGMVHLFLNALDTALRPTLFKHFKAADKSASHADLGFFNLYFAFGFLVLSGLWPLLIGIVAWSGKPEYQAIISIAMFAIASTLPLLIIRFFGLYYVFNKHSFSLTIWYALKVLISAVLLWVFTYYCDLSGTFAAIAVSQMLIILCMFRQFPQFSVRHLGSLYPLSLLSVFGLTALLLSQMMQQMFVVSLLSLLAAIAFVVVNLKHFLPDNTALTQDLPTRHGEL